MKLAALTRYLDVNGISMLVFVVVFVSTLFFIYIYYSLTVKYINMKKGGEN